MLPLDSLLDALQYRTPRGLGHGQCGNESVFPGIGPQGPSIPLYSSKERKTEGHQAGGSLCCRFTKGKSFEDYANDLLLSANVEREFEIIGEALNRFSRITKRVEEGRKPKEKIRSGRRI